ncbi:hypothetical protein EZV62_026419 [Acer yangbiense]|uniref:Gnk2-homologous domain-containing protein n=1 Tax=Acer yangbiense TaxID=1000413 RepID=A0A5C7GRE3_9ROSI|nr:hypothetical protein EZV62_026419 [Acer yangbiense]
MSSLKFSMIFVFLLSLSSSLFTFTRAADPTFLSNNCSLKSFTRNSAYQSNINLLPFSLHSNANGSYRFSNATAGQNPDRVYGLFQYRGDIPATTCQDCVALASTNATQLSVRNPGIVSRNDTYVTVDPSRFDELVLGLMNEAAAQAANDPQKFTTGKGNSTTSQPLYVLVQCTQDLSNNDCSGCLQEAIAVSIEILSLAWELWRSDTPMQLLDSNLADSYSRNEVIRCIHMGLLCVQEDPAARPTMETVVLMLNSLSLTLPLPKQPALFHGSRTELNKQITSKYMPWYDDNAPVTEVYPR